MATSGSLSSSDYSGRYIKFSWERTSYSVANNTSTIKWTLEGAGNASSSYYKAGNFKVIIDGDTEYSKSSDYRISLYKGTDVASGTKTIKHKADGSRTFSVTIKAGIYTYDINCTGTKTFTLTSIPRASSVSATSANVGQATTITISRASSSFTHTLAWECGDLGGTIATKTDKTSVSFTLPDSLYAKIGSKNTEVSVTIGCVTYNGSSQVGSTTTTTIKAKTTAARNGPTLSPTATTGSDTQNLTGNSTTIISGYSSVNITFGASARNSATLSSVKCVNGSKSRTSDGAFDNVTAGDFVFTATDSRGYQTSVTKTLSVINYIKPTCICKVQIGVDGRATVTASGKFYNGSFGKVTNALNIQFRYKVSDGSYSSWTTFQSAAPNGNTWSASSNLTGLDYQKTYYFQARAIDQIPNTATSDEIKAKAMPVFDWGENDFSFNVPMSAPSATISGNVSAGSVSASGKISASNFGRTAWAISDCIDTTYTSGKVTSDNISGYVYHLKGMNFIFFRAIISNWKEAVSAGADAFSAIKLKDEYKPAANTALASYGSRNLVALMNVDAHIRITPHDAIATTTDLYISGFYPLSSSSSLYNT